MAVQVVPFTGTGRIQTNQVGDPTNVTPGTLFGLVYKGFTSVNVYDGVDNTGHLLFATTAAGSYQVNNPVRYNVGVYVECAGAGSGSLYV